MNISALLLHGLGRTPLSMARLARRLRAAGMDARCFGYSATFERFAPCRARLRARIDALTPPYVLIGHSLGTALIRSVLPELAIPPQSCFFLTPPTVACRLARRFASHRPYRWLTGEMGRLLADPAFMAALPIPSMPTTVYVGTRGWRGRFSPFADAVNDGILSVEETAFPDTLPNVRRVVIHAAHTFIMNHQDAVRDMIAEIKKAGSQDVV
ncbi:MAG: alpha/beta fold hydrolase [Proteobacteria bacterium]|nr:alpha/beta fold hydrolase [Pseudomonadota bacterium]MCL2307830.1 alpha/beta fold hydrolase [Pseudomonadota bacterium]